MSARQWTIVRSTIQLQQAAPEQTVRAAREAHEHHFTLHELALLCLQELVNDSQGSRNATVTL